MVSARPLRQPFGRYPLAREVMVAIAAIGILGLWVDLLVGAIRRYVPFEAIDVPGGPNAGLAFTAFVTGTLVILGMLLFAGAFARLRDIDVTPTAPDRRVAGYGARAVAASLALVGAVTVVGRLSGGSLSSATGTSYGPGATLSWAALIVALGLFIAVPAYLLVTHLLVQRSIRRAASETVAVSLTTLLVAALGPTVVLDVDAVPAAIGVGLVLASVALPVVAADRYGRRWLTLLTAVPLALLVAGLFAERLTDAAGLVGVAYLAAEAGVVAVGAYAYEQSDSVVPSALAYATFVVATTAVVFATQVGLPV